MGISPDLAEDIVRRGLLQSLSVRAVRDTGGETGMYEISAGGRRNGCLGFLATTALA